MTFRPLFKSARIALVAQIPEDRELFAAWSHDSDYLRNLDDDPDYRGKGYGPEAIGLLLDYAFDELGLHRVGLRVISYNAARIRAYEKVGSRLEGTIREAVWREGKRWDVLAYGILHDEWLERRGATHA